MGMCMTLLRTLLAALASIAVVGCSGDTGTESEAAARERSTATGTSPASSPSTPSTTSTHSVLSDDEGEGCWTEPPISPPLSVGESTRVQVETSDRGWHTPDIAGGYWSSDQPVPDGAPANGVLFGTATLVDAEYYSDGQLSIATIRIDFDDYGTVEFVGPLNCA